MKTTNSISSRAGKSSNANNHLLRFGVMLGLLAFGAQAGAANFSVWNDSTVPGVVEANDPDSVELGMKFRSAQDGQVTAIRFHKGAGNTGTHVGSLWTTAGVLLGSVTFTSETASGWQQQSLPVPVPISSNTTYIVSYHVPQGHYSVDLAFFGASGVDSFPLRALADGEDGPNGLYAYDPGVVFPNQSFNSANYWVDVVVSIASDCDDGVPPAINVPADVILDCADCNTDPANTGTATATDDCGVTVTYSDVVSGECPKVVTRTWTAIDGGGFSTNGVQTITCLPAVMVTGGSGCTFDRDPATPEQDFRLIFIQDPQNWPCYRLVASNPGQFFCNVFSHGNPGQQITLNLTLPYPFVTKGATPIHAYDWVTVGDGQQCLTPGAPVFISSKQVKLTDYGTASTKTISVTLKVPDSGFIYLSMHLDYGLKGATGYSRNISDDAVDCGTGTQVLIPNHGSYEFSVSGAQNGSAAIENNNSFKRIPGVAGLVLFDGTLDPVPGTVVTLKNAKYALVGSAVADEDGFYMIAYKHTGKAATYYLSIGTPPPGSYTATKSTSLKANAFVRVDFSVP